MRKSILLLSSLFFAMFIIGCSEDKKQMNDDIFDNAEPTDISNIIKIYDKYKDCEEIEENDKILSELDNIKDTSFTSICSDTAFAIQLPQYANSSNKYLANAEWTYNACVYTFNIWSNFEAWTRGFDEDLIKNSIIAMNSRCIRNDTVRMAVDKFKEEILKNMKQSISEDSDVLDKGFNLLSDVGRKIQGSLYKITDNNDVLIDSIEKIRSGLIESKKETFNEYLNTSEEKRMPMILNAINECETFDEQCSLLFQWMNCKESIGSERWILAVAENLLLSDKYNPFLGEIWVLWRAVKQNLDFGPSRDSTIPNDIFNKMRERCYRTALNRIERHPHDIMAMVCATQIGGRFNMNRYGRFYLGNESTAEMYDLMPAHYDNDEEAETEDENNN